MRRKPGQLLALELAILAAMARERSEIHGFSLASRLASEGERGRLISHGTLYKALDRLRTQGLVAARWEDPDIAEREGRPRRRFYCITAAGRSALSAQKQKAAHTLAPHRATP